MTIGERLFELRKSKKYSQEDVANKLNVTRQTVSKWETNQSTPDFDKIIPICKLYGITADELLTGEKSAYDNAEEDIYRENSSDDIVGISYINRKKKDALVLSISVFIYFLSICWIILAAETMRINDGLIVSIFLLMCGVATVLIIYHFVSAPKAVKVRTAKEIEMDKKMKGVIKVLSLIFTVVYLLVSFLTMAWHITWIIWIVYAITEEIVKLLFDLKGDGGGNE